MDSCGGRGIEIIRTTDEDAIQNIKNSIINHKQDYIIQEVIIQCNELMKLNKTTLNTIRVTSLFFKGEPILCNPFFRVGSDKVDHVGVESDCFYYGLTVDGKLNGKNFDFEYKKISENIQGCEDFQIPHYGDALELVREVHRRCPPYIQFIGCDIAFDKLGNAILLEINTRKPFIIAPQCTCGPLFGERTEEIFKDLFSKSKDSLQKYITLEANGIWY